jgi:serine/threonine-protein kinase
MAQFNSGARAESRKTLADTLRTYNWQSAADERLWVSQVLRREAEALILPDVLPLRRRVAQPHGNDERLTLVEICYSNGLYRTAAQLMADAFAADPQLADHSTTDCRETAARQSDPSERNKALKGEYRYLAARTAALAGSGLGNDAADTSEQEKTLWRERAREWLAADLRAWAKTADDPSGVARQMLTLWQEDPELAHLRETDAGKKLTPDEQDQWSSLWNDVRRALRK